MVAVSSNLVTVVCVKLRQAQVAYCRQRRTNIASELFATVHNSLFMVNRADSIAWRFPSPEWQQLSLRKTIVG